MKKMILILLAVVMVLSTVVVTVSAAEESKEDYYNQIADLLTRINNALKAGNIEEAELLLKELRILVYRCARYLVSINEFDGKILEVMDHVEKAVEVGTEIDKEIAEADEIAAEVLLIKTPTPEPEGQHS